MKKIKILIATAIMATMAFSFGGCSLVQRTEESVNGTVVAEVNGDEITLGDVNDILAADIEMLKAQFGEDYEDNLDAETKAALEMARIQVLDMLVEYSILEQKGEELGVLPLDEAETEAKIEEEMQRLVEIYGGEDVLKEELEAVGYTEESYRQLIREDVERAAVIEELSKDAEVTDEEVQAYFDENKDLFIAEAGEAATRHLLFVTIEEAQEASDKIASEEVTFDELFEEYSENKEKALADGATEEDQALPISEDLGVVSHAEASFDPLFIAGLTPLGEGEVSEPIESSFGYHIIEAKDVKESVFSTFEEMEEDIRAYLVGLAQDELYYEKLEALKVEYNVVKHEDKVN